MAGIVGKAVGAATFAFNRTLRFARRGRWPLTIGVRIIVLDQAEHVLLVRHTYTPGWHFPGGAVDPKETMAEAAVRELHEEALIGCQTEPDFVGVYLNLTENKSDHIAVFRATAWSPIDGKARPLEIAEAKFFPARDLPKGTTGGTRRRLNELLDGVPKSPRW
jgi:8-oxo-dGTP pyrophosphatase MutT (NUDIX family)